MAYFIVAVLVFMAVLSSALFVCIRNGDVEPEFIGAAFVGGIFAGALWIIILPLLAIGGACYGIAYSADKYFTKKEEK